MWHETYGGQSVRQQAACSCSSSLSQHPYLSGVPQRSPMMCSYRWINSSFKIPILLLRTLNPHYLTHSALTASSTACRRIIQPSCSITIRRCWPRWGLRIRHGPGTSSPTMPSASPETRMAMELSTSTDTVMRKRSNTRCLSSGRTGASTLTRRARWPLPTPLLWRRWLSCRN